MYKFIKDGCEIIWKPQDKNLGFEIVREVTGRKGTEDNPVTVTEEQREEIIRLYVERNTDPVEKTEKVEHKDITETLAKEISSLKIDNMKEKMVNKKLGQEVANLKIKLMKMEGSK